MRLGRPLFLHSIPVMTILQEVVELSNTRSTTNHDSYRIVLGQCVDAIRSAAPFSTNTDFMLPVFLPSRPIFDLTHAVRYVAEKLRWHGFVVTHPSSFCLHIDWSRSMPRIAAPERPSPSSPPTPPAHPVPAPSRAPGRRQAPPLPSPASSTAGLVCRLKGYERDAKRLRL